MPLPALCLAALIILSGLATPAQARCPPSDQPAAAKHGRAHGHAKAPRRRCARAPDALRLAALRSSAVLIVDPATKEVLFQKNAQAVMPIASLTKLMSALVVLESGQDLDQELTVTRADVDTLKHSSSRLRVGTRLRRGAMLHIALMSSENRAAAALGRNYPGGTARFVLAMNARARALGMTSTRYVEPTGLSSGNVSSPEDLAKLVAAAQRHTLIRRYSTDREHMIRQGRQPTLYRNSNRLIASAHWRIALQKTGYTSEAGRCMVLHARVKGRAVVMVFLDAQGKYSRAADANRVRNWLASAHAPNGQTRRLTP
ncbi:MAG TPA: D-alanyl-D-alanine endopeptidase [Telluria sp.]|nr:D-alanyl-D-alanine endopeptidase [Telluria sp.]